MNPPVSEHRPGERASRPPSVGEIAALATRLRALGAAGRPVDPAERAAVMAAKADLLRRITEPRRINEHRPGGPSAKTSHRAGSPNHQSDSKENPMVERTTRTATDRFAGGVS